MIHYAIVSVIVINCVCVSSLPKYETTIHSLDENWHADQSEENIRSMQSSLMRSYMNNSIDPCDDFYEYACGNWETVHPIPKDKSEYSVFSLLHNNVLNALKHMLEENKRNATLVDTEDAKHRARLFYSTCVDEATIGRRGSDPLFEYIDQIGGWPALEDSSKKDINLHKLATKTALLGQAIIWSSVVDIDLKNSSQYTIYIEEPDLGLENRDDFLNSENVQHLDAYRNLIITTLRLLDVEPEKAEDVSKDVVDFEIQLAKIVADSKSRIEIADLYLPMTISDLNAKYPSLNWEKYLNAIHDGQLDGDTRVIMLSTNYYSRLTSILEKTKDTVIANYIVWRSVRYVLGNLDERFKAAVQVFNEALTGQKELLVRWKECVRVTNFKFGMAVGAMFVRKYFNETSMDNIVKATENLKEAFIGSVNLLNWIDDNTKRLAIDKINKTSLAVGYPDFILFNRKLNQYYEGLPVEELKYFENSVSIASYMSKRKRKLLGTCVDKDQWPMYPTVVNALFEQTKNRIVIPVGILQPPIYHRYFPQALNYGGIGAFIGHELTHGLDDVGREFDTSGNMRQWWGNDSIAQFQEKTDCFIEQYSKFSVHGKFLHGEASKGENIADNGGIAQAYDVYIRWLNKNKDLNMDPDSSHRFERLPGMNFTGKQLFFLGFAQAWCSAIRPEAIENRLQTDNHCPGKFRVVGTLSNLDEFSKVFHCPLGSIMNPTKKCKLW